MHEHECRVQFKSNIYLIEWEIKDDKLINNKFFL